MFQSATMSFFSCSCMMAKREQLTAKQQQPGDPKSGRSVVISQIHVALIIFCIMGAVCVEICWSAGCAIDQT